MSSQLSAHAITAHTAMTRISVSRCSTLPAHRGSASAEKCSTSFSADIAPLPSLIKGEPAQPVSPSEPARPFHALPLDHTVLCEFRSRLLDGDASERLLARVLDTARDAGLLKARGWQRTDSTHVLAAVRDLNRIELLAETLRAALNAIAVVAPNWLRALAPP